jgi:osmotically inducible lipoprotein OsmB
MTVAALPQVTPYASGDAGRANTVMQLYVLFFVETDHRTRELLMSRITYLALCAALALATAACGDTPGQRALTGGAIGAGGGALVGAAAGNPLAGAVVGGLGGAAIGAATTPRY